VIQSLRQIKNRIRSIDSTRKITRAMEMVSSSKLTRVRNALYASGPYLAGFESILKNLLCDLSSVPHPLFAKREQIRKTAFCVISSDTGLCGIYNHNVISLAEKTISRYPKDKVKIIIIGKEANSYFRRKGYDIERAYLGIYGKYSGKTSDELSEYLTNMFLSEEADEIYTVYTNFSSMLRHTAFIDKFLNIEAPAGGRRHNYILEPDSKTILDKMIPRYLSGKMRSIFLNALTSEHSARMFAMKTATDNADNLIETLTLLRNKVRQASITKEVLEIALSAEALKG